jgi:nucleotide sugar dehydrogenase
MKNSNKNISVIGLGYVGLTLAVVLAKHGFTVYGAETNPEILKTLAAGRAHFFEAGLDDLITTYLNRSFFVSASLPTNVDYYAHIVSVGTPLMKGTTTTNLGHLTQALTSLRNVYKGNELVVLRSTVSVGTTRETVCQILQDFAGTDLYQLRVAFCPERTIEGKALEELESLPQIIGGLNDTSIEMAETIFRELTPTIIRVSSLEAAELVKLFNNTYRDILFSVGNCFNSIAQSFGVDGTEIIHAANTGYARSNIPVPGFVGGPCLEKDPYILINSYVQENRHRREINYVLDARRYNEGLIERVSQWLISNLTTGPVVVSGLAFKGRPANSDMRGSASIPILQHLKAAGFELRLHDYTVPESEIATLDCGAPFKNLKAACQGASGLVILNNHALYKAERYSDLIETLTRPSVFFDAWGASGYRPLQIEDTIKYANLGNFQIESSQKKASS